MSNVVNIADFLADRPIEVKSIEVTDGDVLGFLRVIRHLQGAMASDVSIDASSDGFIITSANQQLNADFPFILLNVPEHELSLFQGKTAVQHFTSWFTDRVQEAGSAQ